MSKDSSIDSPTAEMDVSLSLPLSALASPFLGRDRKPDYESEPNSSAQTFLKLVKLGDEAEGKVHDVAVEVEGDRLHISLVKQPESRFRAQGLCASCSRIPFARLRSGTKWSVTGDRKTGSKRHYLLQLDRILRNRDWCSFCRLLFRALCHHSYDPLKERAVQNSIRSDFRGISFPEWVSRTAGSKNPRSPENWPFGCYRARTYQNGDINIRPSPEPGAPSTAASVGIASDGIRESVLANVDQMIAQQMGYAQRKATDRRGNQGHSRGYRSMRSRFAYLDAESRTNENVKESFPDEIITLPCWVSVRVKDNEALKCASLLVDVNTYVNQPRASLGVHPLQDSAGPLQCVSQFTLHAEEEPLPGVVTRNLSAPNTKMNMTVGMQSFHECEANHGSKCNKPLWVKDIGWILNEQFSIRVVDVKAQALVDLDLSKEPRYLCLSYVWGSPETQTALLLKSNLKSYRTPGGMSSTRIRIPQTILDAIKIVADIGETYL